MLGERFLPIGKPKLAVVTGSFPALTERFFAREMNELARRGVDFTIFALRRNEAGTFQDPEFDGLQSRVKYLPGIFSFENFYTSLRTCFTLVHARDRERFFTAITNLTLRELTSGSRGHILTARLRSGGFTHVLAHFANTPSTLGWIAAHESQLPIAYSFHARDILVEAQMLDVKVKQAKQVYVCHPHAKEFIQQRVPGAKNIIEMHHGLPLERFPYQSSTRVSANTPPTLLAVGRNVPKKGWDVLAKALEHPELKSKVRAVLVGEGLAGIFPSHQADLKDFLNEQALIEQHRKTQLFIAPYQKAPDGDEDGIPNAVLEAMALGTPVVGSDAGGLPTILTNETGWVCKAGDAEALAKLILEALSKPDECERRAKNARRLVEQQFNIQKNFQVFLDSFLTPVQ